MAAAEDQASGPGIYAEKQGSFDTPAHRLLEKTLRELASEEGQQNRGKEDQPQPVAA